MQTGMTIEDMRYELMSITKITPDTPDEHVELLYMLWQAAVDRQRPSWSRRECELFFEYLASGNDTRNLEYQALKNAIERGAEFDEDIVGRYLDNDENSL